MTISAGCLQKQLKAFSRKAAKVAGPQLKEAKIRLLKAYKVSSKYVSDLVERNPTVSCSKIT
jgi:hypothetical protein